MRPHDVKLEHRIVPLAWRPPFALMSPAWRDMRPAGETILEMVLSVPDLPKDFLERGEVRINDEAYPPQLWSILRPKAASPERPIAVTLHYTPGRGGGGGGSGGAKTVLSLVAAFALIVVTAGIGAGFAAPILGEAFAAGTVGAHVLAAAVGIAGALAISALTPPPSIAAIGPGATSALNDTNSDQKQPASASGNTLTPGGSIPRVIGTRKVFPPLAGEPIVELVGDDEFVEAEFVLNGPHLLEDVRINGVAIEEAEDVEFETREGFEGDDPITLVTRYGRTVTPQLTLSAHRVNPSTQNQLAHQTQPNTDIPVWHGVASPARRTQDEIWLHFLLPNGISVNGSTSTDIGLPLRIRFRKRGDSNWINLPEVHISDSTLQQRRRAILFQWRSREGVIEPIPTKSGFYYANGNVPGQTALPATNAWQADSYFVNSSGSVDYLNSGTEGTTKVKHINLFDNRVEVYLDEATFPKGVYEIEVKRGAAYLVSSFIPATYNYASSVQDFFAYIGTTTQTIPMSRSNLADTIILVRVSSIINDIPVASEDFSKIAIRARNRDISQLSVLASGWVRDWDGVGWNDWTTTSYPAAHYADILCGAQNIDPLPEELRDDAGLVAWRSQCIANGWKSDIIIDDFRTQDALTLLASCGYARPYQSEIYGIVVDDDVSGESPVQIFSRRNAANVRFERAFARVPDGFIVNFSDAASDYQPAQVVVYQRDRSIATTGLLETVNYDGLVDEAAVIARAQFDLDQANRRSTFYYLDTDIEAIVCRKGDLIGLQHDILSSRCGDGILKSKTVVTGNIRALTLDSTIPVTNEPDMHAVADMHTVADMHDVGVSTGIAIRRKDGTITTHTLSNASGDTDVLTLATPFADTTDIVGTSTTEGKYGNLIVAGELSSVYRRLKATEIKANKDLQASLTAVDEAPELIRYAA